MSTFVEHYFFPQTNYTEMVDMDTHKHRHKVFDDKIKKLTMLRILVKKKIKGIKKKNYKIKTRKK